jgi:hypothetical protein
MNFDGNSLLSLVGGGGSRGGVSSITTTDESLIGGPITTTGDLKINPVLVDLINISNDKLIHITVSPLKTIVNSDLDVIGNANGSNFITTSTNLNAVAINVSNNTSSISILENKTQHITATNDATTISSQNLLITNKINNLTVIGGVYSQTSDDVPIRNTTRETSMINTGVGTLFFPANTFKSGDNFHLRCSGSIEVDGKDQELKLDIKLGDTIIHNTTYIQLEDVKLLSPFELDLDFSFRSIGLIGNLQSNSQFLYSKGFNTNDFRGWNSNDSAVINTTVSQTLSAFATWRSLRTDNILLVKQFLITKTF